MKKKETKPQNYISSHGRIWTQGKLQKNLKFNNDHTWSHAWFQMKFAFKQLCNVNLSSPQLKTSEGNGGALFIISKTCCFIVLFTKDTKHEAGQDSEFKASLG